LAAEEESSDSVMVALTTEIELASEEVDTTVVEVRNTVEITCDVVSATYLCLKATIMPLEPEGAGMSVPCEFATNQQAPDEVELELDIQM